MAKWLAALVNWNGLLDLERNSASFELDANRAGIDSFEQTRAQFTVNRDTAADDVVDELF